VTNIRTDARTDGHTCKHTRTITYTRYAIARALKTHTNDNNIFYKFFTRLPDDSQVDVFTCLSKTRHQAVYAKQSLSSDLSINICNHEEFFVYDLRPHRLDALNYHLGVYDWRLTLSCDQVQTVCDTFYTY
jgi:hypothetical protein